LSITIGLKFYKGNSDSNNRINLILWPLTRSALSCGIINNDLQLSISITITMPVEDRIYITFSRFSVKLFAQSQNLFRLG